MKLFVLALEVTFLLLGFGSALALPSIKQTVPIPDLPPMELRQSALSRLPTQLQKTTQVQLCIGIDMCAIQTRRAIEPRSSPTACVSYEGLGVLFYTSCFGCSFIQIVFLPRFSCFGSCVASLISSWFFLVKVSSPE
jgi:hypothetical protein